VSTGNLIIREETIADRPAVHSVNEAAFGRPDEADLVDALRSEGTVLLSLVAELDGEVAGHILFSRMWVDATPAVALAPMAIAPRHQRHGLGGRLIRDGLAALRARDERIVIVVGHPKYYPRFGFSSAKAALIESPFPREAFMAVELEPGALDGVRGRVRYAAAFGL